MDSTNDILALSSLLSNYSSNYEDEEPKKLNLNPSTLISRSNLPSVKHPIGKIPVVDPKAIWTGDEVLSDDNEDNEFERRPQPKFDIMYTQNVMTEDVYLGLSDKDPSSAHCDGLLIRIYCPNEKNAEEFELDVKKQQLLYLSPFYRLSIYLPYPVRQLDGRAKWDHKTRTLDISLPIIRDEW